MHSNQSHKTAVLVFANSSEEELKHKSIANGKLLFEVLTAQTLQTVAQSQLPYFHFTEKEQIGDSFAERFTNAIQAVYNKGYEQVITIGNDSPQLKVSHILEAKKQLEAKKFVLGPSTDGGFYLMGVHKSQFNASLFRKFAWHTAILAKQIIQYIARSNGNVFRMHTLFDIDTAHDIKSIITHAYQLPKKLLRILLLLIDTKKEAHSYESLLCQNLHSKVYYNKGSPSII